jgi:heptosyltransferase-2
MDFDVVIDLQGNMRSRRITRNVKIGTLVRHRRQRFRRFLTVYAPWIWKGGLKGTVESYADTLKPLGLVPSDLVPVIRPPEERVKEASRSFGAGPFVGICPGGSSSHKRWSEEQFVDLISDLRDSGQFILVLGSEADRPVVEDVVGRADGADAAVYVGNDVGMIAALLSLCAVTVTNDSGLMHLAGAVGSQLVSIFGPTSPLLGFAPVAQGAVIVTRGLTCSPCSYHGNRPCKYGTRQCLEEIDPHEVAGIVSDMAGGKLVG